MSDTPTVVNNCYLETLILWFQDRNLLIFATRSSATVFTTFSDEVSAVLRIIIDCAKEPTTKEPKILGVTLDTMFTFHGADEGPSISPALDL